MKRTQKTQKIPEHLIQALNDVGIGGGMIYVPLRSVEKSRSDQVKDKMIESLRRGEVVNVKDYTRIVTVRTCYKQKELAINEFAAIQAKEQASGKTSEQAQ